MDIKVLPDPAHAFFPGFGPKGIVFEIARQMCSELIDIALGGEQPGDALLHGLRNATVTKADYWNTHCLRFGEDVSKRLAHAVFKGDAGGTKNAGSLQPRADCLLRQLPEKFRSNTELSVQLFESMRGRNLRRSLPAEPGARC